MRRQSEGGQCSRHSASSDLNALYRVMVVPIKQVPIRFDVGDRFSGATGSDGCCHGRERKIRGGLALMRADTVNCDLLRLCHKIADCHEHRAFMLIGYAAQRIRALRAWHSQFFVDVIQERASSSGHEELSGDGHPFEVAVLHQGNAANIGGSRRLRKQRTNRKVPLLVRSQRYVKSRDHCAVQGHERRRCAGIYG